MGKTNWEAAAEQITTKNRLTDAYTLGKTQYNTSTAIAKTSYEDQLARLRESFRQSAPGFDAGQAARGIAGSGFGNQNIWNRAVNQGGQVGTLGKNYAAEQAQLANQLTGIQTNYDTGIKDADLTRWYKEIAFQQSLQG